LSVKVEGLTKVFGLQKAVDNISFEVKKGDILGFLGPNGAGKSTTMKIITCFIPPTSGQAFVNGISIQDNPIAVRRSIGYLPEHNPLYLDMYVREFLSFIAKVHNIPNDNIKSKVDEMVELTGLTKESRKKIGQLSKGYRQRVGLAQAMIHNPDVLILDEPTSGLDPNQLVEIRELIKTIGKDKTVILSTHIMQEVQAMCNRVVIINNGKIVANDTPENLQTAEKDQVIITVEFAEKVTKKKLQGILDVLSVKETTKNTWEISAHKDIRKTIATFAKENNYTILTIQKETQSMESTFQRLTKDKDV